MANHTNGGERSEAQQLEFNRRSDVAYALLPLAADLFGRRSTLKVQIAAAKRTVQAYWYLKVGILGLVLHFVFAPPGAKLSAGIALTIGVLALWLVIGYQIGQLEAKHARCQAKLREVEAAWVAATGHTTFWDIERFVKYGEIDRNPDFEDWWRSELEVISDRISLPAARDASPGLVANAGLDVT